VVITLAIRTPLCKAKRGGFKDVTLDALVFKMLEQVRLRSNVDPAVVDDVCLGNVSDTQTPIQGEKTSNRLIYARFAMVKLRTMSAQRLWRQGFPTPPAPRAYRASAHLD
jgi:acetyl-CoA acetyltransferase